MGRVRRPNGVTPLNDCIQNSSIKIQSWVKSKWLRIQCVSEKKFNVLVWTNGISWTILDNWRYKVYEGWASFGKSSHVVGSNGNLIEWKIGMNIQQGWRHHADLPLPGVQKSHPVLSMMAQPWQGSWRVDTWRKLIQHFLQAKYNFPVKFCLGLVWWFITWVVAEIGKEDKWPVWQNENLKKKIVVLKMGWVSHALQHLAPITWYM